MSAKNLMSVREFYREYVPKQPYKCKDCRKRFTAKMGTIMQASKISVQSWLYAMYLMKVNKKGISSLQLSRELAITQKSAWYMLKKYENVTILRLLMGEQ